MELSQLKEQVLKFLSFRARSVAEVTKYLRSKTSDADLINQTLEYLKKYKLVDDEAFAKWLVESRSRSRPRGSRLLRQELKSKGIDPELTDKLTQVDESELAASALVPKLSRWSGLSYRDFRIKAARFLQSRGFSWSAIEPAVKKAYNQTHVS